MTDSLKISPWQPWIALLLGIVNALVYVCSIILMIRGLYLGMHCGFGSFTGVGRWLANSLLLLQFPLLHSYLASQRGSKILKFLSPHPFEVTTIFTLIAGLQLSSVFLLWSPDPTTWWEPHGVIRATFIGAFIGSWLLLAKAITDAGFAYQTGFLGWLAVFKRKKPQYPNMPQTGLFKTCRQPIYLAFLVSLWTSPVWTADHLFIALLWSTYCLTAPRLKEKRFVKFFGDEFRRYQRATPYFLPRFRVFRGDKSSQC